MLDDWWVPNLSEGSAVFGSADKSSASAPENTHVTRICEFTWLGDEAGALRAQPRSSRRCTHGKQTIRNVQDFSSLRHAWLASTYSKNHALVSQPCSPVELGQNTRHLIWSNTHTESTKITSRDEEEEEVAACKLLSSIIKMQPNREGFHNDLGSFCCYLLLCCLFHNPPSVLPSTHSLYLYSRRMSLQTSGRLAETRACAAPALGYLEEPRERTFKRSLWLLKRWGCSSPAFIPRCHSRAAAAAVQLNICFAGFPLEFVKFEPHLCLLSHQAWQR